MPLRYTSWAASSGRTKQRYWQGFGQFAFFHALGGFTGQAIRQLERADGVGSRGGLFGLVPFFLSPIEDRNLVVRHGHHGMSFATHRSLPQVQEPQIERLGGGGLIFPEQSVGHGLHGGEVGG